MRQKKRVWTLMDIYPVGDRAAMNHFWLPIFVSWRKYARRQADKQTGGRGFRNDISALIQRSNEMNISIACIIDDAAPCINVYWWHVAESQNTDKPKLSSGEPVLQRIPLSFLREFVDVAERWGIKGKFSVLPYPAGLGNTSD